MCLSVSQQGAEEEEAMREATNRLRTQEAQMATGFEWQAEQGSDARAIRPGIAVTGRSAEGLER